MTVSKNPPAVGSVAFTATSVSRRYPGVQALSEVTLEGRAGEVLAICGANGAGKSTFARLLAGQETPDEGGIRVTGVDHEIKSPADAERAGVLLMHQEPLIIDDFSIGENVWLYKIRAGRDVRPWSRQRVSTDTATTDALARVGLGRVSPRATAGDLGPGQRQMLALTRAIVTDHKILILDETTASTTEAHFEIFLEMVAAERSAGVAVVFVSHRIEEVFALSDRIAVLRNGQLVAVLTTANSSPEEVTNLIVGNAVTALNRPPARTKTTAVQRLSVANLNSGPAKDVSFEVGQGEILGIYGLVGSGRSSVARAITGQHVPQSGRVTVDASAAKLGSPRAALRAGLAYVTEDRRKEGFVADFTNRENLSLVTMSALAKGGIINPGLERKRTDELVKTFQVKGTRETMTSTLSGGNQQKVCIAKWMAADPNVVVLDEPTKGIDVGARANIYELIYQLARRDKGIVVVSSEAEEILLLCHRVLVMRDGRVVQEFDAQTATTEDLIKAALGAEQE